MTVSPESYFRLYLDCFENALRDMHSIQRDFTGAMKTSCIYVHENYVFREGSVCHASAIILVFILFDLAAVKSLAKSLLAERQRSQWNGWR